MSLQIWLPLNGNLENQGLSNVTVTNNGATVDNNGKIGKCYNLNGSNNITTSFNPSAFTNNTFSLSIWFNITTLRSDYDTLCCLYKGSGGGWYDTPIWLGRWSSSNSWGVAINNASTGPIPCLINTTLNLNTWYHIAVTYDGVQLKIYLNGNLENTTASNLQIGYSYATQFAIGTAWGGYKFQGKINDIRVYNHALSAKEVKDLAKGLVLHYRLAGPGQENLVPNSSYNNYTATPNSVGASLDSSILWNGMPTLKLSQSGNTSNVYRGFDANILNSLTKGEKYTMTVYAYTKDKSLLDKGMEVRIYQPRANGASTLWGNLSYSLVNNSWVKIQGTYTIDTNATYAFVNMQIVRNGTVWFSPVKVEKGSISTPWCPHKNDALYSVMGYNNNIEYDCSGYHHNGTKSGTITWDVDSPRYTTSYPFNGIDNYITTNAGSGIVSILNSNTHTIACWVKTPSSLTSTNLPYFVCRTPSGSSPDCQVFLAIKSGEIIHSYYSDDWNIPYSFASNTWYHIVFTSNNKQVICYVNGKNIASTTKGALNISINGVPTVGANLDRTNRFKGNLSDFRIYATALSAEDIAELYHSAVIVDNTGKNYAYEYFEA